VARYRGLLEGARPRLFPLQERRVESPVAAKRESLLRGNARFLVAGDPGLAPSRMC
jgi:hypothetical protein